MKTDYVKITNSGKVRLFVPSQMKYFFRDLLEAFINMPKLPLDRQSAPIMTKVALMNELYCKYHTQLSLINGDSKLTLTLSQSYALWAMCQEYDQTAYQHPGMGAMLMQLHQKLS
jgi:hypothetical protein